MWLVGVILIFAYLIIGIISHLCNIARYIGDKIDEREEEKEQQYKPNKYKLEE